MYFDNSDGVLVAAGTTQYAQDLVAPLSQVLSDGSANYIYGHTRLATLGQSWYIGVPQDALTTPFGVTGELQSDALVHLRARWYAPGTGTFTSRDPFAGFAEQPYSLHAYQYAYSAPTMWTDPRGLYSSSPVEHMIQVYYEYRSFRLIAGTVVPEFSIYLGSKTGLLLNPAGRLTGEPTGHAGYIDILDITQDKSIGYAYEIKPFGNPNSNKYSSAVARAEIERYVELYNALPLVQQKSPYHTTREPRVMKLGHLFPRAWQIIGSDPGNPRAAILARQVQNGVIAWRSKSKRRITEPLPTFVFEFDEQTRTVRQQRPTQPAWPNGLAQPQPVCCEAYREGGIIQESGDSYVPYDPLSPFFFYPVPPGVVPSPAPAPVRIPFPIP